MKNKAQVLKTILTTEIIVDNLKNLHNAKETFISNKNSEKITRATLTHNTRITGSIFKHVTKIKPKVTI